MLSLKLIDWSIKDENKMTQTVKINGKIFPLKNL